MLPRLALAALAFLLVGAHPFPCYDCHRWRGSTTRLCRSCHDGTVALAPEVNTVGSHPVGVRYPGPPRFNPWALSLGRYRGTVECASCHNPHARGTGLLRVGNGRSGLCLTCHRL